MTLKEAVEYEVAGSWWSGEITWGWAQQLVARHFLRKASIKLRRYKNFLAARESNRRLALAEADHQEATP